MKKQTNSNKFLLFYDGCCPLCVAEMSKLAKVDHNKKIEFINTQNSSQMELYPQVDVAQANKILHAIDQSGRLLLGLDVTYKAWEIVGKGWLFKPLTWRWLRFFADPIYLWFAKNRYSISAFLTGNARCESCQIGRPGEK
ncbi:thiol-disulfide oxidoreductase DCC family protein [Psychrosphaera aestuarii]|uniref:thiol-disulfide oxidoreductase DCC family protein n=1 Tax=Psychrosphaera aestuarii TaxID=1266052 RepID=UPI001FD44FF4|nr:DUF393 domain-containing protein [Psychrosphaera aestuarii]